MNPIDTPSRVGDREVSHAHRQRECVRFDQMAMSEVAITEMIAKPYARGNCTCDAIELRRRSRNRITRKSDRSGNDFENLDADVPLDREILMRDLPADLGD